MTDLGQNLNHSHISRLYYDVNETDLRFGNVRSLAVVKLRNIKAIFGFEISLREKFNEEKIAPEATNVEIFSWI